MKEVITCVLIFLLIVLITLSYYLRGKITLSSFLLGVIGTSLLLGLVALGVRKSINLLSKSIRLLRLYPQLFYPYTISFGLILLLIAICYLSLVSGVFFSIFNFIYDSFFAMLGSTGNLVIGVIGVGLIITIGGTIGAFVLLMSMQLLIHFGLILLSSMIEDIIEYKRKPSLLRGIKQYLTNFFEILKCEIVSAIAWLITLIVIAIAEREERLNKFLLRIIEILVGIANLITQTVISFAISVIILQEKNFKDAFNTAINFTKKELPTITSVQLGFVGFLFAAFVGELLFGVYILSNIFPGELCIIVLLLLILPLVYTGFIFMTISDISIILGYYESIGYKKDVNELM